MAIPDFNFDVSADNNELDKMKAAATPVENIDPAPAEPFTIEQRQGTTFVTEPPAPPAPEVAPFSPETEDLVKVFAETSTPAPVYDESRERRLQTMAGAGGVAKALMTLGDAFALSRGGIVPRRQMSDQDPYVSQILADRQVFKDKEYAATLQANADKLREATTIAGMKKNDRQFAAQQAQQNYENLMKESQLKWEQGFKEESLALEKEALAEKKRAQKFSEEFQEKELKQKSALGWGQIGADNARTAASAANQAARQQDKQLVLRTPDGKTQVPLEDRSDIEAMFGAITNDPNISAEAVEKIVLLQGNMEGGVSLNTMRNVVQDFWYRSPAAQQFLEGRGFLVKKGAPPTGKVGTIFTDTPQE